MIYWLIEGGARKAQDDMEEIDISDYINKLCIVLMENDCSEWKAAHDSRPSSNQERSTWRSGARSAVCEASQLPGMWPIDICG